jgi:hydrogenase maturation protease
MATLVVGVGNEDRGDDGLGPLAARLLARSWAADPPAGVEVLAWTGDPLGLLDVWQDFERLVLIDAVVSGAEPGTCRRYGPDAPFAAPGGASTHGLGLAAALRLALALGRAPSVVEVWGIEAAEFAADAPLTPAVARAVLRLVERLLEELGAEVAAEAPAAAPLV